MAALDFPASPALDDTHTSNGIGYRYDGYSWVSTETLDPLDLGLENIDNTSDLDKPISTATQTALDGKVDNSRVLTDVPAGAVFTDTDTTYTVGDGGLTEINLTAVMKTNYDTAFGWGNHAGLYELADGTILKDADIGVSVAAQGHSHTGVYEPADNTILKDADIGGSVAAQAHNHSGVYEPADATILKDADIGGSVAAEGHNHSGVYEPADATILKDADIGITVLAPNGDGSSLTGITGGIFGTTPGTYSEGDHNHAGVYEPADATILKDADIGGSVAAQAHNHSGVYEPADATILKDADIGGSVAAQAHTHAGVYEPADGTILKDADIGVSVAAEGHNHSGTYEPADATILKDADIGVSVAAEGHNHSGTYEPADSTILKDSDIGVTVQAYDASPLTTGKAIAMAIVFG